MPCDDGQQFALAQLGLREAEGVLPCSTTSESKRPCSDSDFSKQARIHPQSLRLRLHRPRHAEGLPSPVDAHVKASSSRTSAFFPDKTAAASQEEIFEEALTALPEHIRSKVLHASGGLADARGDLSDVDMTYFTRHPHGLLRKLPVGTIAEMRDPEHTIYSLPGYPREVNLYATMNRARSRRAPAHRATQLALQQQHPDLADAARKLKAGGLGTEKAWAKVLGVEGDVYEEMMNKQKMLALAEALAASKTAKAHKLSRRMQFRGLNISIETDKGECRHWFDPHNKEKGTTKMRHAYGYIRRTSGVDGDHVDVYVGPNEDAKSVYVVHQQKAPSFDRYDEDKCMLGFNSAEEAKKAYLMHYNDDRFFGSMTVMPFEQFKRKVLATFKRPQKIAERTMEPVKIAYILGAAEAQRDFDKEAGKEVAVNAIRKKILGLLGQKTPGAIDEAAEVARLAIRSEQMTPKALESMLKGSKSGDLGTQAEQLRILMAHGKEKALIDPAMARSWATSQGKSTAGLPPVYGPGGKPVAEAAEAAAAPAAAKPVAEEAAGGLKWQHTPEEMRAFGRTGTTTTPPAAPAAPKAPKPEAAKAAPPVAAEAPGAVPPPATPAPPAAASTGAEAATGVPVQTPVKGTRWQDLAGGAALGAGAGLGGGYLLGKSGALAKLGIDKAAGKLDKVDDVLDAILGRANPAAVVAGTGALTGAGTGALAGGEDNRLRGALLGALLGGAGGFGGALAGQQRTSDYLAKAGLGGAATGALGGAGSRLLKENAALGDPMFWQGGEEAMGPGGGGEGAPPASAEDAALALPPGIFQGLQLKVNPDGQRSTTVKVTPDALQTPEALQGIFQAEPETKVEMAMPQATGGEGGGGGAGPSDVMPQGMPLDGAGAMPMPEVPPKVAALHKAGEKTRIERESNPDVSRLYPWKSKKTKAERNAEEMIRQKMD